MKNRLDDLKIFDAEVCRFSNFLRIKAMAYLNERHDEEYSNHLLNLINSAFVSSMLNTMRQIVETPDNVKYVDDLEESICKFFDDRNKEKHRIIISSHKSNEIL